MELEKGEKVVCIDKKHSNVLVVGKIYVVEDSKYDGGVLWFDEGGFNGRLFIRLSDYRKQKIKKIKDGLRRKIQE